MDRHSGDLKVANTIDRESKFVSDGRYTFTVKAVDAGEFRLRKPLLAVVSLR